MIRTHEEAYTPAEEKIITDEMAMLGVLEGLGSNDLEMASPLTMGKIAYKNGDHHAFGWASTSVLAR